MLPEDHIFEAYFKLGVTLTKLETIRNYLNNKEYLTKEDRNYILFLTEERTDLNAQL